MATKHPLLMAGFVLFGCGILFSLVLLFFNIKHRNLRFIKMTSPRVNFVLIVGSWLLYASSLLSSMLSGFTSMESTQLIHQARLWLLASGFTMTFGSMVAKGWRVSRLFQYPKYNTVSIRDGSLLVVIFVLLLLDIGLLTSWQISDPIRCTNTTINISSRDKPVDTDNWNCSSQFYAVWLLVLILYKYMQLLTGCYTAWCIRHITFPSLDDSRCLLLSSGVTLTAACGVAMLAYLYSDQPVLLLTIPTVFIWAATTSILAFSFIPKMVIVYRAQGQEPLMSCASSYIQEPVSEDLGQELVKLLGENRYLKRRLEEKHAIVTQLKKQMSTNLQIDCDSHVTSSGDYAVPLAVHSKILQGPSTTSVSSTKHGYCGLKQLMMLCCESQAPLQAETEKRQDVTSVADPAVVLDDSHSYLCLRKSLCGAQMNLYPSQICAHSDTSNIASPVADAAGIGNSVKETLPMHFENLQLKTATNAGDHDSFTCSVYSKRPATPVNVTSDPPMLSVFHRSSSTWAHHSPEHDLDRICSIAEAYDLPDDTDTYSYISTCLSQTRSVAGSTIEHRKSRKSKSVKCKISDMKISALGSDQLYPDTLNASGSVPAQRLRKYKSRLPYRRASAGCARNVYTNDLGDTLII